MNNSEAVASAAALQSTKWDSNTFGRSHVIVQNPVRTTYMKVYITDQESVATSSRSRSRIRSHSRWSSTDDVALPQFSSRASTRAMRIFISFKEESDDVHPLYIDEDCTVLQLKRIVQQHYKLRATLLPCLDDGYPVRAILTVSYHGCDLPDKFRLVDVGVSHGSVVKCYMKEERDTLLYVHCAYNDEVVRITDPLMLSDMKVADLKSVISRKIGLPYSSFRLTNRSGEEMCAPTLLLDQGILAGSTVKVETWDGFNDLINLAIMGFTEQALNSVVTNDDALARYQTKMLMYIASHYGHVDLVVACIKQGLKADEPIHDHPCRQWSQSEFHPDLLKCPVHVSAEAGQLGVLRYYVLHDIGVIMKNDGFGAKPLNLVLRNRRTECVKFLLTRQWTRITYANTRVTLTLNLYNRMKKWANRARERVFVIYGASKSSFSTKRKLILNVPRVGQDVYVKGWHESRLNSREPTQTLPKTHLEVRTPDVVRMYRGQTKLPPLSATGESAPESRLAESARNHSVSSVSSAQAGKRTVPAKAHYNVKAKETGLLLPLNPTEDFKRPFFCPVPFKTNFAQEAVAQFEKQVGVSRRDLAVRCLTVAADFKAKSWVQRVRLALEMTRQIVKHRSDSAYMFDEDNAARNSTLTAALDDVRSETHTEESQER